MLRNLQSLSKSEKSKKPDEIDAPNPEILDAISDIINKINREESPSSIDSKSESSTTVTPEATVGIADDPEEYFCETCKNNDKKKCRNCGCYVCGGKQDDDKTLACDECQMYFHMACLKPRLTEIPEGDWYCTLSITVLKYTSLSLHCFLLCNLHHFIIVILESFIALQSIRYCLTCTNDPSEVIAPGQQPTISKKKARMPSATQTKDWGRGKACIGLSKKCTVVGPDHVGPIPGIPVGSSWRFRINVA